MILEFYHLREQPFGSTPDSRFLYASKTHREALASILYGVKARRGFIALIATPGMGKTTLLFRSLSSLKDEAKTVFLFQTISTPLDFLRALLKDLGVADVSGGMAELQTILTRIVTEHSQRLQQLIVVIDEAQNLDNSVLELVRMLSNFETSRDKLMQIILAGQPQLARKLASDDLLQLRQRISIFAQLKPFSLEDTANYIEHRLKVAGYTGQRPLFTAAAVRLIAEYSQGIPRNINTLCFNSLSIGAALKKREIDPEVVREVISDLDLEPIADESAARVPSFTSILEESPRSHSRATMVGLALAAIVILAAVFVIHQNRTGINATPKMTKETSALLPLDKTLETTPEILPYEDVAITGDDNLNVSLPEWPLHVPRQRHAELSSRRLKRFIRGSSIYHNEVLVRPGMTFYSICAEVFGTCNLSKVQELRRLNPWLRDSNHVSVGDVLVVPPPTDLSQASNLELITPR